MSAFCIRIIKRSIFLFVIISLVFSCTFSSVGESIDERLSEVDSLIAIGDYNRAWSSLKKIAKTIRSPSETLGVVRRALILQKDDFAKDQLIDILDTHPENQEILAVYTHMLIVEKNYEKALAYAQKLEGGEYGSLYAELRFKVDQQELLEVNSKKKEGEEKAVIDYHSDTYVQAYVDIYNSTGDTAYLRNASLVHALQGNMVQSFSYHPNTITVYENPWFWAQIAYDSHNFEQVIADLQIFEQTPSEMALLADAYVQLGLLDDAQIVWEKSTQSFENENPIAWHNIALHHQQLGNAKEANDLVLHIVSTFPDYVEGLSAYGRFSLLDTPNSTASVFVPLLEEKGLQTIQMSNNATIAHLDTNDALDKIDAALKTLKLVDESKAMALEVEKLKLLWNSVLKGTTTQQKVANIWQLLEENVRDPYGYNSVLVQFSVWYFFTQGMIGEADALFTTHCTSRYASHYEALEKYVKTPIDNMEGWEYEYGGYLALKQNRFDDAQEWLLRLMPNNTISPTTPITSAVNLSTLYNATGKRNLALLLYEQMLDYIKDSAIKADVYYRMALIQYEAGDIKTASILLDEALLLDYNHSSARLLQKNINN